MMRLRLGFGGMLLAGVLWAGGCVPGSTKPSIAAEPSADAGTSRAAQATIPVTIKGHTVHVELARTPAEQQVGLMHRTSMPDDRGMLFVFPQARQQGFWMKDTHLPLSIAFIAADLTITNIADMRPLDDVTIHRSTQPVPYALEMNQGWFAARGIVAGDRCEFSLQGVD